MLSSISLLGWIVCKFSMLWDCPSCDWVDTRCAKMCYIYRWIFCCIKNKSVWDSWREPFLGTDRRSDQIKSFWENPLLPPQQHHGTAWYTYLPYQDPTWLLIVGNYFSVIGFFNYTLVYTPFTFTSTCVRWRSMAIQQLSLVLGYDLYWNKLLKQSGILPYCSIGPIIL